MQKLDTATRTLIERVAKAFHDMSLEGTDSTLSVEGQTLRKYLEEFKWDEARFPQTSTLAVQKNTIQQDVKHMDGELKKMLQKYQDVHANLVALKRKRGYFLFLVRYAQSQHPHRSSPHGSQERGGDEVDEGRQS